MVRHATKDAKAKSGKKKFTYVKNVAGLKGGAGGSLVSIHIARRRGPAPAGGAVGGAAIDINVGGGGGNNWGAHQPAGGRYRGGGASQNQAVQMGRSRASAGQPGAAMGRVKGRLRLRKQRGGVRYRF